MAYTYQGDAILGVSLSVETPKPLDTRTVVNATKDLYEVPASQAYRGMTISNLEDGNIYMLIDKNKINKSEGWKSSQSALQIISCTQEEYDKWAENTDDNYNPINPDEAYISQGVYYYIYEEEDGIYYLSSDWGKNIEEQLSKKASNDAVTSLLKQVNEDIANLANNYTTTETMLVTYVTIASLEEKFNTSNPDSYISKLIAQYYTKDEADSIFVTKASLGGDLDGLEGDNFVFVTSKQYADDQQAIRTELDQTLKLDGEGSLESITVGKIKSPIVNEQQLEVEVTPDGLIINGDRLAGKSEIPIIITISKEEYDKLTPEEINEEAYYYLYNTEEDLVYVTNKDLIASYHTIGQYQSWVAGYGYSRADIDKIVDTLQGKGDYVLLTQLENYYDKTESDTTFLSKTEASDTYATSDALSQLATDIENNYVTKDSLKSEGSEDEDFIFVTQKAYQSDKDANAAEFTSNHLVTSTITINEGVELTAEEQRLIHNGEKVALTKELHKVEYMSEEEYLKLVEEEKTVEDTYYYTYGQDENAATGYVQLDYIEDTYYTKRQIDNTIREINSEHSEIINSSIAGVQEQIDNLTNVILAELESRLQTQIDNMQIKSEISEHTLSLNDNDIMIVEGEVLHILSPSKVSVNGLQIVVD